MARKPASPIAGQVESMRRLAHTRKVADMREGRIIRPITVPSGRLYNRRNKHLGGNA